MITRQVLETVVPICIDVCRNVYRTCLLLRYPGPYTDPALNVHRTGGLSCLAAAAQYGHFSVVIALIALINLINLINLITIPSHNLTLSLSLSLWDVISR